MTNKRRKRNQAEMDRSVKPLNVSPLIKCMRWSILGLGIFYGITKRENYKNHEIQVRPIREKQIKEKHIKWAAIERENTAATLKDIGKDFEVTEFPEGWDEDL